MRGIKIEWIMLNTERGLHIGSGGGIVNLFFPLADLILVAYGGAIYCTGKCFGDS